MHQLTDVKSLKRVVLTLWGALLLGFRLKHFDAEVAAGVLGSARPGVARARTATASKPFGG